MNPPRRRRYFTRLQWFCVECLKEQRPYIYVDVRHERCPYGHKRKKVKA